MEHTENEIRNTLLLYTTAQVKMKELKHRGQEEKSEYLYYDHIITLVERWLEGLEDEERELLQLRYFKQYNYDHIAMIMRYANHSSVSRQCKKIIQTIRRKEMV